MIDRLSGLLAKIIVGLFFLLLFFVGLFIGGTALHDPDTCWIVALGRYMFEHGGIPSIEPFSYTFADVHRPLVLYQWMTELCFYGAIKLGGLSALLMLVTTLVMIAFVIVPMKLFQLARARWYQALPVIILVLAAAFFHFLARPEMCSYVFLSSLLLLLTLHRLDFRRQSVTEPSGNLGANPGFDFRLLVTVVLIMVAWANFHTGFTSGLAVLFSYVVASVLARLIFKIRPFCDVSVLSALIAGSLVTVCNPYGAGLWSYIPSLFFASFNHLITELNSVDFRKPEFTPFCLFLALFVFFWTKKCMVAFNNAAGSVPAPCEKMQVLESFVIFSLCVFEGWSHLRLIPFVALVMMSEIVLLLAPIWKDSEPVNHLLNSFDAKLAEGLAPPLRLGSNICSAIVLLVGLAGTAISFQIQSPVLPQSGGAFKLPIKALEVLNSHHANEHILNDPQFGDALIWYHPDAPKVFVDTRFDMYGENLVRDYLCMQNAEPGWQELIDKYGVKAVFLKPGAPLLEKLKASSSWEIEYSDKDAAVLFRH